MKSDELIADEILSDKKCERELNMDLDPAALRAAIVRALQAAREEDMDANDVDLVSPREASIESIVKELREHNEEIGSGERSDDHLRMDAKHIAMVRHDGVSVETFAMMLTDATLAKRAAPPGHIIDDAGVVRKVLGTLPVTADGCVVGVGAQVWFIAYDGTEILWAIIHDSRKGWLQSPVCYSTAKAAEAAKEGKA